MLSTDDETESTGALTWNCSTSLSGLNPNEWLESVHFGSGLDSTVKICHKNGLAFTLLFCMHGEIICIGYTAVDIQEWELTYKNIESHGHRFCNWNISRVKKSDFREL